MKKSLTQKEFEQRIVTKAMDRVESALLREHVLDKAHLTIRRAIFGIIRKEIRRAVAEKKTGILQKIPQVHHGFDKKKISHLIEGMRRNISATFNLQDILVALCQATINCKPINTDRVLRELFILIRDRVQRRPGKCKKRIGAETFFKLRKIIIKEEDMTFPEGLGYNTMRLLGEYLIGQGIFAEDDRWWIRAGELPKDNPYSTPRR